MILEDSTFLQTLLAQKPQNSDVMNSLQTLPLTFNITRGNKNLAKKPKNSDVTNSP